MVEEEEDPVDMAKRQTRWSGVVEVVVVSGKEPSCVSSPFRAHICFRAPSSIAPSVPGPSSSFAALTPDAEEMYPCKVKAEETHGIETDTRPEKKGYRREKRQGLAIGQ